MNGVATTSREAMISELDAGGFDFWKNTPRGWRESLPIDALAEALAEMRNDAPEYPDISELVDAIEVATAALLAAECVHRAGVMHATPDDISQAHQSRARALASCQNILSQIKRAREAT